MTEDRAKRLVSAGVATAVAFLVILLAVLVYQMICLKQLKKEHDALTEAEAHYEQLKEDTENEISIWMEEWKIVEAARKYGFRSDDAK